MSGCLPITRWGGRTQIAGAAAQVGIEQPVGRVVLAEREQIADILARMYEAFTLSLIHL